MTRGYSLKTPVTIEQASTMRAAGMAYKDIAKHFGISKSTAHEWVKDPGGHRLRIRKESYGGTCDLCGGPTIGWDGPGSAADTCADCLQWTPGACLEAVAAFAAEHDRSPRVADIRRGNLPRSGTARRLFGSWNDLLLSAGLPLNMDRRRATTEAMADAVASGLTYDEVGEQYGCSGSNVSQRLAKIGVRAIDLRPRINRCFGNFGGRDATDPHGVRRARLAAGLSQASLAALVGIDQPLVSKIEHGVTATNAYVEQLLAACDVAVPVAA